MAYGLKACSCHPLSRKIISVWNESHFWKKRVWSTRLNLTQLSMEQCLFWYFQPWVASHPSETEHPDTKEVIYYDRLVSLYSSQQVVNTLFWPKYNAILLWQPVDFNASFDSSPYWHSSQQPDIWFVISIFRDFFHKGN